jgi:hypothetical protein
LSSNESTPYKHALEDAAAFLVSLNRLEQGPEVAFSKTFVALALNEFEEQRSDLVLREDL